MKLDINNLPKLLTVKEVSDLLEKSIITIKRWEHSNKLVPIRINSRGDRRYKKSDVLRLINN